MQKNMSKNLLYLVDNKIIYYAEKNACLLIKQIPSKILCLGKIAEPKDFDKYLKIFIKENKIISGYFKETVTVIIDDTYTTIDKNMLKDILEVNNFKVVKYINEKNFFEPKRGEVIIILNEAYKKVYVKKGEHIELMLISSSIFNNKDLFVYLNEKYKSHKKILIKNENLLKVKIPDDYYICTSFESYLITKISEMNNL